jgi:hypothetical protein
MCKVRVRACVGARVLYVQGSWARLSGLCFGGWGLRVGLGFRWARFSGLCSVVCVRACVGARVLYVQGLWARLRGCPCVVCARFVGALFWVVQRGCAIVVWAVLRRGTHIEPSNPKPLAPNSQTLNPKL